MSRLVDFKITTMTQTGYFTYYNILSLGISLKYSTEINYVHILLCVII